MDAATLIRTSREAAGLSQDALAARAGTSQPAISRYESGVASPSVETLDRLLAAMGQRLEIGATSSPRHLDVRSPRMAKLRANRDRVRRIAHRAPARRLQRPGLRLRRTRRGRPGLRHRPARRPGRPHPGPAPTGGDRRRGLGPAERARRRRTRERPRPARRRLRLGRGGPSLGRATIAPDRPRPRRRGASGGARSGGAGRPRRRAGPSRAGSARPPRGRCRGRQAGACGAGRRRSR
ncbi:helix-turn-helix transcriptional regulator [Cellulomonas palmilytica]|nr:helix-turn-helix transcriptional regulator [Cellulomonas palmilytica]